MNVVFVSPHFPPNYYLFCARLRELGVQVLGIADQPWEQLRPELRLSLDGYRQVADMDDLTHLRRALTGLVDEFGPVDRLEAHNEHWLEPLARLRTEFGIPGVGFDKIGDYKRKSRMKAIYRQWGIPVARGGLVQNLEDALGIVKETGYPVIGKPDVGVGAAGTYKLHDDGELKSFFALKPAVDYVLEEFIDGTIYSFDGLSDGEGRIVFCTSHVYSDGVMEVVNHDRHVYYTSLREIPADLQALGERTLKAFDGREIFFHFEFFRTRETGDLVAIEANMRPPGGPTLDMCNFSADIDLYRQWARIIAGKPGRFAYERKFFCCYISRKEKNPYLHCHEEILEEFGDSILLHHRVEPVFSRAMGDYAYVLRAAEQEEIFRATDFIQGVEGS